MKKKVLLPIILSLCSLVACKPQVNKEAVPLLYGSIDDSNVYQQITYQRAAQMIRTYEDNLALVIADTNGSCACYGQFKIILDIYTKETDTLIYVLDYYDILIEEDKLGLTVIEGTTAVHIIEKGKVKFRKTYTNSNTDPIFTNYEAFQKWFEEVTIKPQIMYLSLTQLRSIVTDESKSSKFILYYTRSTCPHCQLTSFSKEMLAYFKNRTRASLRVPYYALELSSYNTSAMTYPVLGDNPNTPEEIETDYDTGRKTDNGAWLNLKFELGMGNLKPNKDLDGNYIIHETPTTTIGGRNTYTIDATEETSFMGNKEGFTPSWSYVETRKNATDLLRDCLLDFNVGFNGTLLLDEGGDYLVIDSWYSPERIAHLPSISETLNGFVVPASDVQNAAIKPDQEASYRFMMLKQLFDYYL